MYIPKLNKLEDDNLIAELIAANGFATLMTSGVGGLQASHLPFEFDCEKGVLLSHLARANPQWRDFDGEVLVVFQGAHGYISPRWYETDIAVPTWNYLAVHVYGTVQIIADDGAVAALLERLVLRYESGFEVPWKLSAPDDWQAKMRGAVVAFEISIERIEAKAKLSQNRSVGDREGVIAGLELRQENELAAWMRRLNPTA